jgi:ornithine cyclodeaminase/alanine dehydrogenase-like protein (mu-crystallin family)
VDSGLVTRGDVTQLCAVLADEAPGRTAAAEITSFDSTGLAIQDLAIAAVAFARAVALDVPSFEL